MSKTKHLFEFEINAPAALLYSYLTIPKSLGLWFADKVMESNGIFNFVWDNEDHKAKIAGQKLNQWIKYQYLPKPGEEGQEPSFVEFRIEANELTQTCFLKITDVSSEEDPQIAAELWKNIIFNLRESLGA
ncbi:MAG: START-like domain-containing protein [Cytophagaceae bacterium]|jgi:uncharacterized protein YndB with AHSA1/START domain|nr:START-like domain-containing protein [Cytophagaceae bacterium]